MERIRIGSGDIAISWAVYDIDGLVHDFSDKELELYMACGGYKVPVTGYTIQDNVLSWVFKQEKQTKTGDYKLILVERVPDNGGSVVCVERAFRLTPEDLIACDIIVAPYDIAVRSIITYSSLVGVASVDVVESDDDEGNNIVSIILNNGHTVQFTVKNGSKGDKGDKGDQGNSGYQGAAGELEVVNNLTDGGETAALSAEMGKRLKGLHDDNVGRIGALERISERVYDDEGYVASDSESYPATIAAGGGAIEYEDEDQNKKIAVIPDSFAESQIAGEDGVDYETLVSETRIAALRGKVDGIAEGAQVNEVEIIRIPDAVSDVHVSSKKATLPVDSIPTGGSKNLVLSGVIAEALSKKAAVASYTLTGASGIEFSVVNNTFLVFIEANACSGSFFITCTNDDYTNAVVNILSGEMADLGIEFHLDRNTGDLIIWCEDGANVRIFSYDNVSIDVTELSALPSEREEVYISFLVDNINLNDAIKDFITKSVSDLVNYYTKSQTYTKAEVNALVEAIKQFTYQVVATLPTASADTMNIIFLVPSSNPETQNVKDEFITIQSGSTYYWEQIGSTEIDLSGYSTTVQMNAAISAAVTAALGTVASTYATKTEVNQLGQEINEFFEYSAAPSDVTWIRGKYISLTGELKDSQSYGYTSPVPIKKGEVAVVYVGSYLSAAISKTDAAGNSYTPVVTVETSPGPSSQLFRYEYLADEDGYVAFSGYWGTGFYGFVAKADMIFALKQDVEGAVRYDSVQILSTPKKTQARENIDAAGEDDVNFKLTADVNATIGFQNWAYGYVKSNGTIEEASSGSWRYSGKIPIVPDTPIVVNKMYCYTTVASVASYDVNDNFIAECSLSQSTNISESNPVTIQTTGKNVAYIRITIGGGYPNYDVTVTQYSDTKSVKEAIIDVQEQLDNISIGTQWNGKSWVALGTSITDTKNTLAPDGTSTGKFVPFLVALSGLVVSDKGVAGAVIGGHILYYAGHSTETADADIVTIEGGVNDWAGNRPLGQVGDTTPYLIEWTSPAWNNGGSPDGTYAGACYQAIKTAMENSPKALVVVLTDNTGQYIAGTGQHCERERQNSLGLRQKDYTDMLIAVAHYMGVPVINAGQRSMINQDNPEYLIDQIHQTELGGEQYANTIWSDLKNFPCRITE